ncbi:MAG: 4-demethylwyosine synthase TYW1 [bacterium]|nr:4-demethylwyosine synthase TYW1 [bacterium]
MPWELVPEHIRNLLYKQKYVPAGKHTGVKLCHWTKEALLRGRACYKQVFYGIQTHRCLQMSPAITWCHLRCFHCWRPSEYFLPPEDLLQHKEELDEPKTIVELAIQAQQQIIKSFYGLVKEGRIPEERYKEAMKPNQVAISLVGEPLIYPYMDELVKEFKARDFTVFIVTNGMEPKYLEEMTTYPMNLYLSVHGPTKQFFGQFAKPYMPLDEAWQRLIRFVELFRELRSTPVNTVYRITLIKGMNDSLLKEFARFVELGEPKYVEVKAYMAVGFSRFRLGPEYSPSHAEVRAWAEQLAAVVGYEPRKEVPESRVVLLMG